MQSTKRIIIISRPGAVPYIETLRGRSVQRLYLDANGVWKALGR